MSVKPKSLLAALALVLVASCAHAAGASAAEFHAESGETKLSGTQIGESTFTVNAGTVSCKSASYTGFVAPATTSQVTIAPTYSECKLEPIGTATVTMNGCAYVFYASGTGDIECPEGKKIEVVAKLFGVTKCTVTVGAQSGLSSVTYTNMGSGTTRTIQGDVSISGGSYVQDAGSGLGACKHETPSNATVNCQVNIQGSNNSNEQKGIWKE